MAIAGFLATLLLRRAVALPARAAAARPVTVTQRCSRWSRVADSPYVRELAWATAAIAVYALWDYGRTAARHIGRNAGTTVTERRGSAMRGVAGLLLAGSAARAAAAQEFVPPKNATHSGTRIGLFGFGVRGGVDLRGSGQLVLGTTLDAGNLFSNRLRLRPSAEIGVFNGPNTYVGSVDALWRFTEDEEVATPYVGLGFSVAGRTECSTDPQCPDLWLNLTFGFELRYRSTFNWLLEYRGMDALARHRIFVGLTTRRGN